MATQGWECGERDLMVITQEARGIKELVPHVFKEYLSWG